MCNCIQEMNNSLAEEGQKLTQLIIYDLKGGNMRISPPVIASEWIGKKPRGKKLLNMLASYCPFCGESFGDLFPQTQENELAKHQQP